jgi:hypothetical protein
MASAEGCGCTTIAGLMVILRASSAHRQTIKTADTQASAGQGMAQHGDDLSLMGLGIFILASMLLILNSPVQ